VQIALYRIAQEALNNVVKHAGASRVEVSLRVIPSLAGSPPLEGGIKAHSGVELRISDDGRGFEVDNIPPISLGLSIMRERAETISATLKIETQLGRGTQVVVIWPGGQEALLLAQGLAELTR
jgi:signal transduction histidine kinase